MRVSIFEKLWVKFAAFACLVGALGVKLGSFCPPEADLRFASTFFVSRRPLFEDGLGLFFINWFIVLSSLFLVFG